MSAIITQEQLIQLLKILGDSKIISELVELNVITTDDNYLVVNKGTEDAKKVKIPLIRGFLGDYNASTNTPSLSNGTGLKGDTYNVSVAGSWDFGNGAVSLIVDDIIYYNGAKWVKLTQTQISDIVGLQDALNNIDATRVAVDSTNFQVLTETDDQALWEEADSALLKARGTELLGGTGLVTFTIGTTVFSVSPAEGQIKDSTGYYPISFSGAIDEPVISTSNISIYVYIDKNNSLQQQTTEPTRSEYREKLFLTRLAFTSGTLAAQEQISNPGGQYTNLLRDYLSYVKSPKKGLGLSGNANLTFQVASGSIFELGIMNSNDADNPNEIIFTQQNPASYFYLSRNATLGSGLTNLNVTTYDLNGVQTTMTNNRFKILTVYKFGSGNHVIQDGQNQYTTLDEAETAIASRTFVKNPVVDNGTRIGWIIVAKNATDLTNPTQARFKNDDGDVSTSSTTTGALLASNNLSDLENTTTARTNLGINKTNIDALGINATQLDGLDSTDFARLNTSNNQNFGSGTSTFGGLGTFNANLKTSDNSIVYFGTDNDSQIWFNGNHTYFQTNNGDLYYRNSGATNTIVSDTSGEWTFYNILNANAGINASGQTVTAGNFQGNGSSLTNLNATNILTGTLADARLSSNVALLDGTQTFTGVNTFSGVVNFDDTLSFRSVGGVEFTGLSQDLTFFDFSKISLTPESGIDIFSGDTTPIVLKVNNSTTLSITDTNVVSNKPLFATSFIADNITSNTNNANLILSGNNSGIVEVNDDLQVNGSIIKQGATANDILLGNGTTRLVSTFVDTTTNQTSIGGNKTFTGTLVVLNDIGTTGTINLSTGGDIQNVGKITSRIYNLRTGYTVATLPSATIGDIAYVTDAGTVTYRGTASGGGSNFSLVIYNGTNWIYH